MVNMSRAKTKLIVPVSLEKTTNAIAPMTTLAETVLKKLSLAAQIHVITMVHV